MRRNFSSQASSANSPKSSELNHQNRLRNSYILCAMAFFGLNGLHRFYNGKVATGALWFLTCGLFGVGQLADLLFMPKMVNEYEQKLRQKLGINSQNIPLTPHHSVAETLMPQTKDEKISALIRAASRNGGKLSVTQAVLETRLGFQEVEALLHELAKTNYVEMTNDLTSGAIIYDFIELS